MRPAVLKLEAIRDNQIDKLRHHRMGKVRMGKQEAEGAAGYLGRRPFVKRVIGATQDGRPVKRDIKGRKSYTEANSIGSRGVYYWWTLDHGCCVQIQEAISIRKKRRYYAIVIDGALHEISEKEAALYGAGHISLA